MRGIEVQKSETSAIKRILKAYTMPPDLTEEERYNLLCVVAAIIQFNMKPGADHKDATHVFLMREAIMP